MDGIHLLRSCTLLKIENINGGEIVGAELLMHLIKAAEYILPAAENEVDILLLAGLGQLCFNRKLILFADEGRVQLILIPLALQYGVVVRPIFFQPIL